MRIASLIFLGFTAATLIAHADDGSPIPFPDGYRNWHHHHSTVNLKGHAPEGNTGLQHVYADPRAVEGLKSGRFADGATFVVDRFTYEEAPNSSLVQGKRKVVAVMVRDAVRLAQTGGWGFQAFKGGDPSMRAVSDGGTACFSCHAPLGENNFLFTRNTHP